MTYVVDRTDHACSLDRADCNVSFSNHIGLFTNQFPLLTGYQQNQIWSATAWSHQQLLLILVESSTYILFALVSLTDFGITNGSLARTITKTPKLEILSLLLHCLPNENKIQFEICLRVNKVLGLHLNQLTHVMLRALHQYQEILHSIDDSTTLVFQMVFSVTGSKLLEFTAMFRSFKPFLSTQLFQFGFSDALGVKLYFFNG